MATLLRLALLGDFRAVHRGEPLRTLAPLRLQSLLAYLVLRSGIPQDRQRLAFTFWPDSSDAQARTNLRQLFHTLRRALPDRDRFLAADRRTLLWRADAPASVDVVELEGSWRAADAAMANGEVAGAIAESRRAAQLYAGDLMPGCYDRWIEPDRDRLRGLTLRGLARLVTLLESRREYGEAVAYVQSLLRLDPFREESHQALIRLHMLQGEWALAARAYRDCAAVLERELGVGPGPETRALFERVQRGESLVAAQPAADGGRSPVLVGRHGEWRRLVDAWERTTGGDAGLVVITGDAGIGKTRLAQDVLDWAARQGFATARARCYAAEGLLTYDPVAQWLRGDAVRSRFHELDPAWRAELARVLPELDPRRAEAGDEGTTIEGWRRLRLFEAMARAMLAPGDPLLLLLDDLQWCDADTLAWLHYLLRYDDAAPLLILATMRTGEAGDNPHLPAWLAQLRNEEMVTELELGPLGRDDTARLAEEVAERELGPGELDALHRETEGIPLFVVEMVRASGAAADPADAGGGKPPLAIPGKVQNVIRGRLAQLSSAARDLVGLAATMGRDFALPVLRRATGAEDELIAALDELLVRQLVREQGDRAYDFTHDKIREVAYAELSSARRTLLHERVARALAETSTGGLAPVSGEIARHLERAGQGLLAIPHYRRAAERALSVYAGEEAAGYLRRALELLAELPDTDEWAERELELQTALGAALVVTDHYSGARVWEVYTRAQALCARIGSPPSPPVLRALALASLMRSQHRDVLALGRALLRAAEGERDPMLEVEAHYVMGVALYWHGRIPAACRHLQRALERYDPRRARAHLNLYIQDPAIICGVRLAIARWHEGEAGIARRLCLETLERAESLGHPFSLAYARYFGSWVLIECGDLDSARRQLRPLIEESLRHRLAAWATLGTILEGWLRTEDGDIEAGLEQMRRGAGDYDAMEVSLGFPYHQGLYARACRRGGRTVDALRAVGAALAMAARTRERFWDAELLRLRGELLLERGASPDAPRRDFTRALEVARGQGARSLELRAALALTRLERDHGDGTGATELLRRVHDDLRRKGDPDELRAARDLLATARRDVAERRSARSRSDTPVRAEPRGTIRRERGQS